MNSEPYYPNELLKLLSKYKCNIETEFDKSGVLNIYAYPIVPIEHITVKFFISRSGNVPKI